MCIYHSPYINLLGDHWPWVTESCRLQPEEVPCHCPSWCWDYVCIRGLSARFWPGACQNCWPQATTVVYSQPYPEAIEAGQAGSTCHLDFTKPSTSLPTLPPPGHFTCPLTILRQVGLTTFKQTQTCPSETPAVWDCPGCPKGLLVPLGMSHHSGVLPQGCDTSLVHVQSHYPELGVWCPWVG